jgi:hypothetical protein
MKDNKEYQNHLFRLAVVLYADNNYDVKLNTVHKKIIESVLLECGQKEFSVNQIIDFCQKNYKIVFDEKTIMEVVKKNTDEFLSIHRNNDTFICLSEKRKQSLNSKINNKTIDFFIAEFIKEYQELTSNVDTKFILYKFLYAIFTSNAESFQKLIDTKRISETFNFGTTNYTEKEKEIINNFLQWDNAEKNKAIFDISSYALEYCMLTNSKSTNSIQMDNLRNKIFYLDTNIIYRALGINGENRKNRSITFLSKFSESKEQLIISKSTDIEFRKSIKSHIDRIKRYNSPRVNSKVYQEYSKNIQPDIFNFYHNWRIGKINPSLELFEAYILGLYDTLIKKQNITVDYSVPYNAKDKKVTEKIDGYTTDIYNFKSKEGEVLGSSEYDAENIYLVECKRNGKVVNLFDTKFFLISTDQGLRRWDYQRLNQTPIVLLPSQWLSILLRYVNRTEDDFKSFVSFLNLKNNEILIDNEKLQIVIAGISEMTTDLETQRNLLNNIIENKFNDVLSKESSYDEIFDNSKKYAKTKLEEQIEELNKKNETLSNSHTALEANQKKISQQLEKQQEETDIKIKNIDAKKSSEKQKLLDENKQLKEQLQNQHIANEIKKWKRTAYWFIPLILIIIIFFLLQFFFENCEWNFVQKLVDFIDSNPSETKRNWLMYLNVALFGSLMPMFVLCYNRLVSKDKWNEKRDKILKDLPQGYK